MKNVGLHKLLFRLKYFNNDVWFREESSAAKIVIACAGGLRVQHPTDLSHGAMAATHKTSHHGQTHTLQSPKSTMHSVSGLLGHNHSASIRVFRIKIL